MTDNPTGRVCYFNGKIVPESEAVVSFRDRGFKYGDAVFDTTRTFGHRIFRLGRALAHMVVPRAKRDQVVTKARIGVEQLAMPDDRR